MKSLKYTILVFIAAFCYSNVSAQGLKIYKKDHSVINVDYTELDSIVAVENYMHGEFVDLGLSVEWGTCNIGAIVPEEIGNYYAYGETVPKTYYDQHNYLHGYVDDNGKYVYKNLGDIRGYEKYDAASANWNMPAHLPTSNQINELIKNCEWAYETVNGVEGMKFTSKINGKSIFLPFTGFASRDGKLFKEIGNYWSSDRSAEPELAVKLTFKKELKRPMTERHNRMSGLPVRAVREKRNK